MRARARLLLWRVLCSLCLLIEVNSQWRFNPPKNEGEECGRDHGQVWKCQRESKCAILASLRRSGKKITCSERRGVKVICCPVNIFSQRISVSVSEKKCQEYRSKACTNRGSSFDYSVEDNEISFPGAEPERKKRNYQTEPLLDYPSMDELYDVDSSLYKMVDEEYFADEEFSAEEENSPFTSLFGGIEARSSEFPHSAMIGFGGSNAILWNCGGTLISERFVLSAAHCSDPKNLGPARWARLGDLDYSRSTDNARPQDFQIIKRHVHSGYKEPAYYNDIVLFQLDRDAVFDNYVAPACLHQSTRDPTGTFIATGWGRTERHKKTTKLMKVDLYLVSSEDCWVRMADIQNLKQRLPSKLDNKTMLCAWNPKKDTCSGDSGGPLVLANQGDSCLAQLVGITSFGLSGCDASTVPGAYVRVTILNLS